MITAVAWVAFGEPGQCPSVCPKRTPPQRGCVVLKTTQNTVAGHSSPHFT